LSHKKNCITRKNQKKKSRDNTSAEIRMAHAIDDKAVDPHGQEEYTRTNVAIFAENISKLKESPGMVMALISGSATRV